MPIGNSLASAEAAKASLKRTREETTLRSAEQRVATEVSSVIRDVEANRQRLPLTANAVTLAERRLDAEQRKLVVGLSTGFLVFQAQRDLTTAREGQVKSVLDYRLSLADLQAAGTISVRR
jgi:outer membrane protein TolC